eukprot:Skav201013  [mRNA]  locus=scaffold991:363184:369331:- [translate_table: standard]
MIDHVEMLEEHLTNDDPKKRIKAAEAMSAYIADNAFLPEKMEVAGLACISAARCLGIMGRHAAPFASAALTRVLGNAGSDLRYEALVLASGSAEMRRFAMETIAVIGKSVSSCSKAVAHHLKPLPGRGFGSDPTLRLLAVLALEAMGPEIVYEQEVLMSRAIKDPAREVGEQAFLTLRDAGCVKGMMGSMYLEERIFSPEVLAATKFATQNSDSENDSDSDSSDSESEDVEDFGSSASEAEEEEASEDLQAQQAARGVAGQMLVSGIISILRKV